MRLKVLVKRHGLPDAPVVWSVESVSTISQFLEQINEVLPLESSCDWGLEDYAVELSNNGSSFECMHFQSVGQVLKEDDEVTIRPLLTQDVRQRKLSGRHQISTDGRHLVDGYPFGRARLRDPKDRPSIDIPPRKRRRILFDAGDEESWNDGMIMLPSQDEDSDDGDFQNDERQIIVRPRLSEDTNIDDEDDAEYEPTEEDVSEMLAELNDLQDEEKENAAPENVILALRGEPNGQERDFLLQHIQVVFPTAPKTVCKTINEKAPGDSRQVWDSLSRGFAPAKSQSFFERGYKTASEAQASSERPQPSKRKRSMGVQEIVDDENDADSESASDIGDDEEERIRKYYDEHGLAGGSIASGRPLTLKPKFVFSDDESSEFPNRPIMKTARSASIGSVKSVRFAGDDTAETEVPGIDRDDEDDSPDDGDFIEQLEDASSNSDSDSDSSNSSSDDTDSSDSGDDNKMDAPATSKVGQSTESSSSSSGGSSDTSSSSSESNSDSDSDSNSGPEEASSKQSAIPTTHNTSLAGAGNGVKSIPTIAKAAASSDRRSTPPGQGLTATKRRNERRRQSNALERYKRNGLLPAGTTLEGLRNLGMSVIQSSDSGNAALSDLKSESLAKSPLKKKSKTKINAAADAEFATRRQQLLDSLASGGVEVGEPNGNITSQRDQPYSHPTDEEVASDVELQVSTCNVDSQNATPKTALKPSATEKPTILSEDTPGTETSTGESIRKRAKLDMGAGRRLLFGALGIKTPQNKADEEKVKNDLMKYAKPLTQAKDIQVHTEEVDKIDVDSETWRSKIILRAVECCHEGVEYSEPPFPFVQRWDPQQQGGYSYGKRGGKGKRKQRQQAQFYDSQPAKEQKNQDDGENAAFNDHYYDEYTSGTGMASDYQSAPLNDTELEIQEQLIRGSNDSQEQSIDDLPALPEDVSVLPALHSEDIKPGAVIAFKQLIMSEATQWQPQMSDYRTAVVIQAPFEGSYELRLAKRDREYKEKQYDQDTGDRIYGRFDAPDEDEEEFDDDNDGYFEASFNELVDAKLVQSALPITATNNSTDDSVPIDNGERTSSPVSVDTNLKNQAAGAAMDFEGMEDDERVLTRGKKIAANTSELLADEITDEPRQEYRQFVREADLHSNTLSSAAKVPELHDANAGIQSPKSPKSHVNEADTLYSPRYNGVSSSARIVDNDFDAEDVSIASSIISLPSLQQQAEVSQPRSHVTDHGHQPDGFDMTSSITHQFEDIDLVIVQNDDARLNPVDSQLNSPLPQNIDISPHRVSSHVYTYASEGSSELPASDDIVEMYSTARSLQSSAAMAAEEMPYKTRLSSVDELAAESYNRAMERLDEESLVGSENSLKGSVKDEYQQANFEITSTVSEQIGRKRDKTANGNSKDAFVIPPGSQQVDLVSSEAEPSQDEDSSFKSKAKLKRASRTRSLGPKRLLPESSNPPRRTSLPPLKIRRKHDIDDSEFPEPRPKRNKAGGGLTQSQDSNSGSQGRRISSRRSANRSDNV